jgi:prepilin-type N-terminal cleavage/methylation domain-containing protein
MLMKICKTLKRKGNQKGFTLVELLIVMAILAILVAIAVPRFGASLANAKNQANEANIMMIKKAAELAVYNEDVFPDDGDIDIMETLVEKAYMALIPIVGFQVVSSTYFQAVGKAKQAAVLSLSRQVLFFIPLLIVLPRFWGVEGVWRAAPIADFLAVCLSATMMYFEMRKIKEQDEQSLANN